jgi:hypothetical protein
MATSLLIVAAGDQEDRSPEDSKAEDDPKEAFKEDAIPLSAEHAILARKLDTELPIAARKRLTTLSMTKKLLSYSHH